jgi:hypothetical protein
MPAVVFLPDATSIAAASALLNVFSNYRPPFTIWMDIKFKGDFPGIKRRRGIAHTLTQT